MSTVITVTCERLTGYAARELEQVVRAAAVAYDDSSVVVLSEQDPTAVPSAPADAATVAPVAPAVVPTA